MTHLCPTCGLLVPDIYTSSHHPNNCPCGTECLHAADGNNQSQEGCIWLHIGRFDTPAEAAAAFSKLLNDREAARIAAQKGEKIQ